MRRQARHAHARLAHERVLEGELKRPKRKTGRRLCFVRAALGSFVGRVDARVGFGTLSLERSVARAKCMITERVNHRRLSHAAKFVERKAANNHTLKWL